MARSNGRRARGARGTPATVVLERAGVRFRLHPYPHDPRATSFGAEAATALGVEPGRVFKTLVVDVDGRLAVALVPVDTSLDLKAVAAAVGGKRAALAETVQVERSTGYVVGGISPFGQRTPLPTLVDTSVTGHPTVYVSGGRRGLQVEVSPADLLAVTGGATAAVARTR